MSGKGAQSRQKTAMYERDHTRFVIQKQDK